MAKAKKRTSSSHDRTETEADQAEQRAAAGDLTRVTPGKTIVALLKKSKMTAAQIKEITDDMAADIAAAAESKFLHRRAFAMTKALDKMEPEKAAETMAHFLYYMDVGGVQKKIDAVARLPMGDEVDASDDDGEGKKKTRAKKNKDAPPEEKPSNVVKSDFGRKLRDSGNPAATQEAAE